MSRLFDAAGRPVTTGRALGTGGEGTVYEIQGIRDRVAKLYHEKASATKAEKLEVMARSASTALTRIAAWPVGTLHASPGGELRGILMPRVEGYREIHHLYGPAHRKQSFPTADWAFLVHTARNAAAAVAAIHEAGHVIGDVNQGNLVVSANAMVQLIDCDSFQIRSNGKLYPCEVGVAHFTPPELQGKSFSGIVRTANHDSFGLAVLVFHLLFMGRHPYAGRYLEAGDMPIERAIQELRFAFGSAAAQRKMQPPPHTLPLSSVSGGLAQMFERAFSAEGARGDARPSAKEWVGALERLKSELRTCSRSSAHRYHGSLSTCPWCEIERTGGPDFFISAATIPRAGYAYNVSAVWSELLKVAPPPTQVPLPSFPSVTRKRRVASRGQQVRYWAARAAGWAAAAFVALALFLGVAEAWWVALALFALHLGLNHVGDFHAQVQRREKVYYSARSALHALQSRWNAAGTDALRSFQAKRSELDKLYREYQELDSRRRAEIVGLDSKREQAQRHAFLEKFFIEDARIKGIGPGRLSTLESYGIETAADITPGAVQRIPGFGPRLTGELMAWRRRCEAGFRFNPHAPVDPAAVAAVEQKFALRRQQIERVLAAGAHDLKRIVNHADQLRAALEEDIREKVEVVAEARAQMIR